VDIFSKLVDQLVAYEPSNNPLYYDMLFIDGLRDDISPMVMIQRPSNLDSACALALVQEEALDAGKKKDYRRVDSSSRFVPKPAFPLPAPPKLDKPLNPSVSDDRRSNEVAKGPNVDDKSRPLRQYHSARGLCEKCVEKWIHGHTCAPTVQFYVIQEVWELLPESTKGLDTETVSEYDYARLCMFLSKVAAKGVESQKSMRLLGQIHGKEMMILLHSGSSNSFISAQLTAELCGVSVLVNPLLVNVASGAPMKCVS
jgi:hypothetical protein